MQVSILHGIVWRNGLGAAKGHERLRILEAEYRARQEAVQEWYLERLEETGGLIVDSHDISVRGASTFWGRKAGYLYLRIVVYGRSTGRIRTFHWRAAMSSTAHTEYLGRRKRPIDKAASDG